MNPNEFLVNLGVAWISVCALLAWIRCFIIQNQVSNLRRRVETLERRTVCRG